MERRTLENFSLTPNQIEQVMAEYGRSVKSIKEQAAAAQSEIGGLKEQLGGLQDLQQQTQSQADEIATLTAQIRWLEESAQRDRDQFRRDVCLDTALKAAGARNTASLRGLLNLDDIHLEDGQLTGLQEQLEALKVTDEYLFCQNGVRIVGASPHEGRSADEEGGAAARIEQALRGNRSQG